MGRLRPTAIVREADRARVVFALLSLGLAVSIPIGTVNAAQRHGRVERTNQDLGSGAGAAGPSAHSGHVLDPSGHVESPDPALPPPGAGPGDGRPAALPSPTPRAGPGELEGPCPVGQDRACVLDLKGHKAPVVPPSCLSAPWSSYLTFEQPSRLTNSDGDDYWESVVRINLDPNLGCGCAVFVVTYDDPSGFTVDLGDSPTNDGWGGDAGTTPLAAEAHVLNENLYVYTSAVAGKVDQILLVTLPGLPGRSLILKVCDEAFAFELEKRPAETTLLHGVMSSLFTQRLFAIGGQSASGDREGPRTIEYDLYAAFNRVIHVRGGAPASGRTGKGVRRAAIYLTP